MGKSSFVAAVVLYLAGLIYLSSEVAFLAPYRLVLWREYGLSFALFSVALLLNLSCAIYGLHRRLSLKDTGRRLAHMERQLRGGPTISEELSGRIRELGDDK